MVCTHDDIMQDRRSCVQGVPIAVVTFLRKCACVIRKICE